MKAGKALNERRAEVRIQLKSPPGANKMFDGQPIPRNEIVLRLQPDESIYMKTNVKAPGLHTTLSQVELDLSYGERYEDLKIPDAYTRLILDTLRGKQATFVRGDELNVAWEICDQLLVDLENVTPIPYKFGSRGPVEADELIAKAGYEYNKNYKWSKRA